jgi:hypothetical protein
MTCQANLSHGRSSYASHRRFQALQASVQVATTERILQEPYHSRPFVVMRRSLCCFSRSGETTPLFNHGRSSYGASHRRFQVLQASVQVAGILKRILQEPYHSRPFVVMLRRSLLFVRSGETTPLFNHGRSSYGASHRRSTTSFGSGSWYTTEKDPAEPYHSRPFVVMLRRSLCCFS